MDFNGGWFDLSFDRNVVKVEELEDGCIDGETIPIGDWGFMNGRETINFFFLEKTLLLRKSLYGKFASPKTCAKRITRLR